MSGITRTTPLPVRKKARTPPPTFSLKTLAALESLKQRSKHSNTSKKQILPDQNEYK